MVIWYKDDIKWVFKMKFERPNVPKEVHELVVKFARERRMKLYGAYEVVLKAGLERIREKEETKT